MPEYRRSEKQFAGRDKLRHQADIYELAPGYDERTSARIRECFDIGAVRVEFVAVRLYADPFHSDPFKYRLRLRYPAPPAWMLDPMLTANWRELRESVKNGMACDGQFAFDRETRQMAGGGGSCWWAHRELQ